MNEPTHTDPLFNASLFLKTVTHQPGVYRMYDAERTVIYVGKAKDLKKRLSSYFRTTIAHPKTKALVKRIAHIDVTVTHSETDALILEHNYIKEFMPKYNVLLRDDKSYPYILLTAHKHPKIGFYRGAKRKKGEYFGPYPESMVVRNSLQLLQKLFPIRQCEDATYANRDRPCLMYQIDRCSAPCVAGYISDEEYQLQVNCVRLFLKGKDRQIIEQLVTKMEEASHNLLFEKAARYRDQIQSLRRIQQQQTVNDQTEEDIDYIGYARQNEVVCIHLLMLRQGKILGSRSYYPKVPTNTDDHEIMRGFLYQYYLDQSQGRLIPPCIVSKITPNDAEDEALFLSVISELSGRKIQLQVKPTGNKARFFKLAQTNAEQAVTSKLNSKMTMIQRYASLKKSLHLDEIMRMECFDISHTMGESTIASCVVFNHEGPYKTDYRRYNITGITGGDDYAAMAQVLERRYGKVQDPDKIPDIIFIDGGKGQLGRAIDVLDRYRSNWHKQPLLIGIAKGVTRKAGLETLIRETGEILSLPDDSPALHLIQFIRDESHRHAIGGHRLKRDKTRRTSTLEEIEGVGAKRRQALLHYMGGLQELSKATVEEIAKVPGISKTLAETIYDALKKS